MNLELHVPGLREMPIRAKWLADPETMAYNSNQDIDAEGYDRTTGCIDFPMGDWRYWREVWLYQEPDRFSAYLRLIDSGDFVGECCYYADAQPDTVCAGVLIAAQYRNKGYASQALKLLCEHAFKREEIQCVCAELPINSVALKAYTAAGFKTVETRNGIARLEKRRFE